MTPLHQIIRANYITRYHATPEIPPEPVGQHQNTVAQIIFALMKPARPSVELIYWANHHDNSELATGDIFGPAKADNPDLRAASDRIAAEWEADMGIAFNLTPEEWKLAELADKMAILFHVHQTAPHRMDQLRFNQTRAQVEGLAWQIGQPMAAKVQAEIRGLM